MLDVVTVVTLPYYVSVLYFVHFLTACFWRNKDACYQIPRSAVNILYFIYLHDQLAYCILFKLVSLAN